MRILNLADLYQLRSAGLLRPSRFVDGVLAVRQQAVWARMAEYAVLALGVAHVLAGVIFFFAYNWADLPPVAKFALVESGLVLAVLAAIVAGPWTLAGSALMIVATVLTGVLFAVIGQVYQTGADAYELFVAWAVLVFPWTLLSRSAAHWLVWCAITYAAIATYCHQVLVPMLQIGDDRPVLLLGAFLALILILRELAVRLGLVWLGAPWTRYFLLFLVLSHFFTSGAAFVLFQKQDILTLLAFLGVLAASLLIYRTVLADFPAFALSIACGGLFLMVVGGRLAFETFSSIADIYGGFLFLVIWCVLVTVGTGKVLLALRAREEAS